MRTRRSLIGAVGAAGVAGLAGCSGDDTADDQDGDERQTSTAADGTTDGDSSDWRQRDGGPARTGSNTAMSGLTDAPSSEVLYEPDSLLGVQGEPVVEDGQLYFFTSERLIAVSTDGQQQWEFGISQQVGFGETPAVLDGTAYFSGNDSLVAVSGGERQWAQSVSFGHEPVVTGDAIYVETSDSIRSYTLDGDQRWEQSFDGSSSTPAVEGSTVYHQVNRVFDPNTLYARSASDGSVEWSIQEGDFNPVPVVADGTVYGTRSVSGGTAVVAMSDGSVQWESEPMDTEFEAYPVVGDESVFILADDGLQALDTGDGTMQWDSPYVPVNSISNIQPRVDADSVYIMEDPSLVALNRENGQQRWATEIGDDGVDAFCPAGGSVYAAGDALYELS